MKNEAVPIKKFVHGKNSLETVVSLTPNSLQTASLFVRGENNNKKGSTILRHFASAGGCVWIFMQVHFEYVSDF